MLKKTKRNKKIRFNHSQKDQPIAYATVKRGCVSLESVDKHLAELMKNPKFRVAYIAERKRLRDEYIKALVKDSKKKGKVFSTPQAALKYLSAILRNPEKPDPVNVLRCIESLTLLYQDGPKGQKVAETVLDEIYRYAHLFSNCENQHEDWLSEYYKNEAGLLAY